MRNDETPLTDEEKESNRHLHYAAYTVYQGDSDARTEQELLKAIRAGLRKIQQAKKGDKPS